MDEAYIPSADEAEDEFDLNTGARKGEWLSTYDFFMDGYMADAESDTFVFIEKNDETDTSYLHLFKAGQETVWNSSHLIFELVTISDGWIYFTAEDEASGQRGLFGIRADGTGLRQVGNGDIMYFLYEGTYKDQLVFRKRTPELGDDSGAFIFVPKIRN